MGPLLFLLLSSSTSTSLAATFSFRDAPPVFDHARKIGLPVDSTIQIPSWPEVSAGVPPPRNKKLLVPRCNKDKLNPSSWTSVVPKEVLAHDRVGSPQSQRVGSPPSRVGGVPKNTTQCGQKPRLGSHQSRLSGPPRVDEEQQQRTLSSTEDKPVYFKFGFGREPLYATQGRRGPLYEREAPPSRPLPNFAFDPPPTSTNAANRKRSGEDEQTLPATFFSGLEPLDFSALDEDVAEQELGCAVPKTKSPTSPSKRLRAEFESGGGGVVIPLVLDEDAAIAINTSAAVVGSAAPRDLHGATSMAGPLRSRPRPALSLHLDDLNSTEQEEEEIRPSPAKQRMFRRGERMFRRGEEDVSESHEDLLIATETNIAPLLGGSLRQFAAGSSVTRLESSVGPVRNGTGVSREGGLGRDRIYEDSLKRDHPITSEEDVSASSVQLRALRLSNDGAGGAIRDVDVEEVPSTPRRNARLTKNLDSPTPKKLDDPRKLQKEDGLHDLQDQDQVEKLPPSTFAFGDIHGDYTRFRGLLLGAGLAYLPPSLALPSDRQQVQWLGSTSTLILVGDIIDRGPQPFSCYVAIAILKNLAAEKGGRVELLFGNHEVLRIMGNISQAGAVGDFEREQLFDRAVWEAYALEALDLEVHPVPETEEEFEAFRLLFLQNSSPSIEEHCVNAFRDAAISRPEHAHISYAQRDIGWQVPVDGCFPESLREWLLEGKGAEIAVVSGNSLFVHGGFELNFMRDVIISGSDQRDEHWFFVSLANNDGSFSFLTEILRQHLSGVRDSDGFDQMLPAVWDMFWTRDFWQPPTPASKGEQDPGVEDLCATVEEFLAVVNESLAKVEEQLASSALLAEGEDRIERIVTGHTPQDTGMVAGRCAQQTTAPSAQTAGLLITTVQPLLINIDVGMTRSAYNWGALYLQINSTSSEESSGGGSRKSSSVAGWSSSTSRSSTLGSSVSSSAATTAPGAGSPSFLERPGVSALTKTVLPRISSDARRELPPVLTSSVATVRSPAAEPIVHHFCHSLLNLRNEKSKELNLTQRTTQKECVSALASFQREVARGHVGANMVPLMDGWGGLGLPALTPALEKRGGVLAGGEDVYALPARREPAVQLSGVLRRLFVEGRTENNQGTSSFVSASLEQEGVTWDNFLGGRANPTAVPTHLQGGFNWLWLRGEDRKALGAGMGGGLSIMANGHWLGGAGDVFNLS